MTAIAGKAGRDCTFHFVGASAKLVAQHIILSTIIIIMWLHDG